MKTICRLLVLSSILCGCKPEQSSNATHWSYRVVRVENDARREFSKALGEWSKASMNYSVTSNSAEKAANEAMDNAQTKPGAIAPFDLQETISDLGNDGWELCASFTETETIEGQTHDELLPRRNFRNTRTGAAVLIFKRPL
jgi:hypothetical protein